MHIFGIKLVGIDAQTGTKVLFTLALVGVLWLLQHLVRTLVRRSLRGSAGSHAIVEFPPLRIEQDGAIPAHARA